MYMLLITYLRPGGAATSMFQSFLLNAYSYFVQQFFCGTEGRRFHPYVEKRKQRSCLGFVGFVVGKERRQWMKHLVF